MYMSYKVLARKWRPRIFTEMAGQEHILQTLINALDQDRLHHAYLFTGTRGVGKTSIARILAKALNCEKGVSSNPCDECSACVSISEGRFLDLIEVDAASRTKVDDTRELLENVQYSPSVGRFKVYLIDEVHMLSTHSFNALLKTLEEPPAHVKFLFATTDPQKLPVTILSRCLQFNLKNISPQIIVDHLKFILDKEKIVFEEPGLWLIGRAADGSMRDALSLTDQAVSYGAGKLKEADISDMLGSINPTAILDIVRAVVNKDGSAAMAFVQKMSEHAPNYNSALEGLLSLFHQVALAQSIPEAISNNEGDKEFILEIGNKLSLEDTQLFYQIALLGRRDLPLAPEPRVGFEMVLLRMLAFYPDQADPVDPPKNGYIAKSAENITTKNLAPDQSTKEQETSNLQKRYKEADPQAEASGSSRNEILANNGSIETKKPNKTEVLTDIKNNTSFLEDGSVKKDTISDIDKVALENISIENWFVICNNLALKGILQNIAINLSLLSINGKNLYFVLDETQSALYDSASHDERLALELSGYFDVAVTITIKIEALTSETPRSRLIRIEEEEKKEATKNLKSDPNVNNITNVFDGILLKNTVKIINK